jgi:PKD repeat protein
VPAYLVAALLIVAVAQKANNPPIVVLTSRPAQVYVGTSVTFDGTGTTDPGSPIGPQRWAYAFGDGGATSGTGPVVAVTHVYAAAGTFTVTLNVTDNKGLSGSAAVTITVLASADTTPPSTPTNLNPSLIAQTSMTITWSASTDNVAVASYEVWMTNVLVQTVTGPTANFVALTCETLYTVAVNAVDTSGNRSVKASLTVQTATCGVPPPILTNPSTAVFTASADHNTVAADGQPLVTSYRIDLLPASGSLAVASKDIGKPTPDAANDITYAELASVYAVVPNGDYVAKVAAVGPGGSTISTASDVFSVLSSAPPPSGQPYGGTAQVLPGTVQCENYDLGGEGVAYHDTTASNDGGGYRPAEAVDIEPTSDPPGGYQVGWVYPGEWANYTVNVQTAGVYTLGFRVASPGPGGTFHLTVNGVDATGPLTVPDTTAWYVFTTVSKASVALAAGQQSWRLVFDANGPNGFIGNFNWISVQ